ncbi:Dnag [Buchnera aphidicola str. G002 (Myzus persicae)]|uniref:DNA primase n=1 Tax=Buchnera aphidicola str. USDA (Myzus persicae) TaxID=1009856 RepID=W0P5I6_BUCMP|nr:DNA primase [Buchnera aphidicola]AHG60308.1 Dnag [Buchnera aphidicola str. USDA (Myzus persicae)]AHG60886.1 Dnag [Buchnera aphidicola str. W106 (Myzus persicae)]AHG61458.1 Dnag [Buchnera aphidicola str. G002 (Myzus persicae)]WAI03006.1 MAG: DNA primase [Buchnera aphidicola (Myzus persicae)]
MSGKIPKSFITELLFRTNIVELINTRIKLKKYGKNYQTNCPFHHDKTPSFTVSNEKQFYYCFGCNAHGNAIDFLINYEHLSFIESIEELSMIHGMQIPFENTKKNNHYNKKQNLYLLMEKMCKLYQKNIIFTNLAHQYLAKRGINKKMIDFFLIGFSSLQWKNFYKKLDISKKLEQKLLHYNIISISEKGYKYDRFQGRIIFPIQDHHGRIVGFGSRAINNIFPKYLNSPETDIFHKGKHIYGLYQVKKKCNQPKYLLVVEGYIDVITLTQYNINYVVSSLGTATTNEHIQILFQNTDVVIYCYDGDDAGKNAAWRILKKSLPHITDKKTLKFILLPNNEDPDSIIRKEGTEAFQKRIDNAITLPKFFFRCLLKNVNLSSNDDKFYLSSRALPLINNISSDTVRIYLRQILARMIGILDDHQFEKFLYEKEIKKNEQSKQFQIKRTSMRTLIALLIQNPILSKVAPSVIKFKNFKLKGLPIFLEILQTCINNPNISTGQLLELYRNSKIINILKILSSWDHMIVQEEIQNMFLDLLMNIYDRILQERQEYLISKERKTGLTLTEKKEIWSINKALSKNK